MWNLTQQGFKAASNLYSQQNETDE